LEKAEEYLLNPESAPAPAPTPDLTDVVSQQIRVLVVDFSTDVTITANTPIHAEEQRGGGEDVGRNVHVYSTGGDLYVSGKQVSGYCVTLSCSDQSLTVADRRFRGELRVVKQDRGFIVINRLPLEDYLRGVIPREMPASWSVEALKAQAVAARTYALYQIEKHQDEEWDVMATVMSQVYGGRDAETPGTDQAVRETAGQILTFNDRPILAYFHASSGGYTESTEDVWGTPLPYIEAVRDPYSNGNPTDNWEAAFTRDQVNQALVSEGIGGITDIAPAAFSPTGRVTRIRFQTASGAKEMPANTTRLRLGSTSMKSTWWQVSRDGESWRFHGKGYGHGVGMSQWGARGLASEGKDYLEILRFYYPLCQVSGG
jgi:stage II sporulation protein D